MTGCLPSTSARLRRYLIIVTLVFVLSTISLTIYKMPEEKHPNSHVKIMKVKPSSKSILLSKIQQKSFQKNNRNRMMTPLGSLEKLVKKMDEEGKTRNSVKVQSGLHLENTNPKSKSNNKEALSYDVHLFYYPWYGNIEHDGKYVHWNHKYIPHWRLDDMRKWPLGVHEPPDDIGANFYPAFGPYSSSDPGLIDQHMKQIKASGAGVIAVSWYPPNEADGNGEPADHLIPRLLKLAHDHGIKIAIHIEPYKGRSGQSLNKHVKYIIDSYGQHPSFYRKEVNGRQLPVFYIYDSYQIQPHEWAKALKADGEYSVRGTQYDSIFLGLYLGPEDEQKILASGFDGFYTYFAANGFTKGSTWSNWKEMAKFAAKHNLLFVPSAGPGYEDTRIRPWNADVTRKRLNGIYFRQALQNALDVNVEMISVTSFNEWHEGTQIETAVPKTIKDFKYEDYSPGNPNFYLQLLQEYVEKFVRRKSQQKLQ